MKHIKFFLFCLLYWLFCWVLYYLIEQQEYTVPEIQDGMIIIQSCFIIIISGILFFVTTGLAAQLNIESSDFLNNHSKLYSGLANSKTSIESVWVNQRLTDVSYFVLLK